MSETGVAEHSEFPLYSFYVEGVNRGRVRNTRQRFLKKRHLYLESATFISGAFVALSITQCANPFLPLHRLFCY
jgi:hypothetical protein